MYYNKTPIELDCGLHYFKETLNSKWKLMLVYYISEGYKRPSELQRAIPNADRRVLAKQLTELTLHGFITKEIYNSKIQKVEYSLTKLGINLLPLIYAIERWGQKHQLDLEDGLKKDPKLKNIVLNYNKIKTL